MSVFNDEGRYRVVATNTILGESKKKKTPQVEITIDILGVYDQRGDLVQPERVGQFPPCIFLSVTEATMGTPSAPGWVAETLTFLGFNGDFDQINDDLLNKEFDALCQYDTNEGKETEKWSVLRPRAPRQQAEKPTVRKLNALFSKLFKAAPSKNGQAAPPPPKEDEEPPAETPAAPARKNGRKKPAPRTEPAEPQPALAPQQDQPADDIPF